MDHVKNDVQVSKTAINKKSSKKVRGPGVASSTRTLKGAIEVNVPQSKALDAAISVVPFVLKTVFIFGVGWLAIRMYKNRFTAMKYRSDLPVSNITDGQAKARASAIGGSINLFDNSFENVVNNIRGLNYNGFVKLYNAFGHQTGSLFSGELDLIEWVNNQFTDSQIQQLRFLMGGQFF